MENAKCLDGELFELADNSNAKGNINLKITQSILFYKITDGEIMKDNDGKIIKDKNGNPIIDINTNIIEPFAIRLGQVDRLYELEDAVPEEKLNKKYLYPFIKTGYQIVEDLENPGFSTLNVKPIGLFSSITSNEGEPVLRNQVKPGMRNSGGSRKRKTKKYKKTRKTVRKRKTHRRRRH